MLLDDAEVAEFELAAVADEDVEWGQVAMQQLAAVQLAEDFEDAGDLAARGPLRPAVAVPAQIRAQVAEARVLERQAVADLRPGGEQRKRVKDPNGPWMFVEQLAEVRFAEPAVDARADLDAEDLGDVAGPSLPAGEVQLARSRLRRAADRRRR